MNAPNRKRAGESASFLSAEEVRERYGIDLVTAEVLRRGLLQLTQQMLRQMTRTSTAPIMRDYRDCTFQIHQVTEQGARTSRPARAACSRRSAARTPRT
jgi:hypothetical protein